MTSLSSWTHFVYILAICSTHVEHWHNKIILKNFGHASLYILICILKRKFPPSTKYWGEQTQYTYLSLEIISFPSLIEGSDSFITW